MKGCNYLTKDPECWFEPEKVEGSYILQLEEVSVYSLIWINYFAQAYDRAVLIEILRLYAVDYSIDLQELTYEAGGTSR